MSDPNANPESLHPNLARIAVEYDQIVERYSAGQMNAVQANAAIEQLEARDDQGVRWSIDPASGRFMRKTFNGDVEYDTPPAFGVQTPDAFSYTTNPQVANPNDRIDNLAAPGLTTPPTALAGATRNGPGSSVPSFAHESFIERIMNLPLAVKAGALIAIFAVVLAAMFLTSDGEETTPVKDPNPIVKKKPTDKKPQPGKKNKKNNQSSFQQD